VTSSIPPKDGNHAVTAVDSPKSSSDPNPSTCSRRTMISRITPMARKPGISRTVCSQPISTPVKPAASMTKLLSSADHVAKAMGMAKAMRNSRLSGRRQRGSDWASSRVMVRKRMPPHYARTMRGDRGKLYG